MTLHKMFTNNMVLQANKPTRVFGERKGKANVRFLSNTYQSHADGERWEILLPPMPYGGPYEMQITLDGEIKTLENIMIGEVILCAGQSNMRFAVADSWRADLKDPTLPFVIVQIADLDYMGEEWTALQEAQKKAVSLIHNARFVVTKDVSDHTNIHPADKRKVSERVYQVLFSGEQA